MNNSTLKNIRYAGIAMQIPKSWKAESAEYDEADGSKSYSLCLYGNGRDARSIDLSIGMIPEGSDAYVEASRAYEDVICEEDLQKNDEPIVSFDFQSNRAYGFNILTDDGMPCFFFCVGLPSLGKNSLLTVLACAPNEKELQNLVSFVEEHLSVE